MTSINSKNSLMFSQLTFLEFYSLTAQSVTLQTISSQDENIKINGMYIKSIQNFPKIE